MTTFYRQKLIDAVRALVDEGDLNLRLTHAAGHLIQIDDKDMPEDALAAFERVRDPLIQTPMVSKGEILPRDLEPGEAKAAAQGVVDLLAAEMGNAPRPASSKPAVRRPSSTIACQTDPA